MGNALSLALSIGVPLASGAIIGIKMAPEIKEWYPTIKKPSWNPPNWIFGPVWSVLYAAMGVASWRVWKAGGGPLPLGLYGLQLALNLVWSPLFFFKHDLKAAAADITVLLGVLAATIVEFHKVDPTSAYLLLPYLGWTTFATALTYNIMLNNTKAGDKVKGAAAAAKDKAVGAASEATAQAATVFLAQANERQGSGVPAEVPGAAKDE